MRILVCGGTGLVGSSILAMLVKKGYTDLHATYMSRSPRNFRNVTWHKVDLRNQAETEELFANIKPDHVYLAAAKVGGMLANTTYKAEFIYDNLAIALNVINSARKFQAERLISIGSATVYPEFAPQPIKEEYLLTGLLDPTKEPYAVAKISAAKLVRYYNEQYKTNYMSVMPTNLYGPNDNFNLETSHVLPALIRKFHLASLLEKNDIEGIKKDFRATPIGFGLDAQVDYESEESLLNALAKIGITKTNGQVIVTVWGTGEAYREFLYSEDLADACVYLMEKVDAEEIRRLSPDYFVNVGTGVDIKLKDLVEMVKQVTGFSGTVVYDAAKPEGTPRRLLDVSKINALGWKAKTDLEAGIKIVYEAYKHRLREKIAKRI
ncbi:GDP-L-fucose synthase family protein [Fervidobacterium changbaicum]|uniref:GDP-L-fucose synthase n=1 Tax=Fervidobacterium changbaicum TaxID=310769 RepID=A0ABX5QTP9_9BACT|nr:GDP-L-fucose synthase [Fervidobacterium changbaicum]QAV33769.1 GDP-L-fucose synthase [Fervidobacterium changbaicum]